MNTITITRTRSIAILVGLVVALASALVTAVPAGAAPVSGMLSVYRENGSSRYCYYAYGTIAMSRQAAQFAIADGAYVQARMWGEDPSSDDLVIGPQYGWGTTPSPNIHVTDSGLEVLWYQCGISGSTLNEDWGEDELYAGFNFYRASGAWMGSFETNRVYGSY